jgi:hypothetical protein
MMASRGVAGIAKECLTRTEGQADVNPTTPVRSCCIGPRPCRQFAERCNTRTLWKSCSWEMHTWRRRTREAPN